MKESIFYNIKYFFCIAAGILPDIFGCQKYFIVVWICGCLKMKSVENILGYIREQ